MEFLAGIIIFAAISNFLLGLFVFTKGPSKRLNRLFGISCFIATIWIFANLMMGYKGTIFWLESASAFGFLLPLSALLWILELCDKKITKRGVFLLGVLGFLFFIISYINNLIVTNVKRIYLGGFEGETGPFFPIYFVFIFGILTFILYLLISNYRKTKGIKKLQIGYILVGAILYISTVLSVSFILPLFGNLKWTALDSPSSLFLLFFTTLAIARYHLFEIRVILTELLVGAMGIILLILPFVMPTGSLKILTATIFLLFCVFAYYLIKATHKEEKRREEAERMAVREAALRQKAEKLTEEFKRLDQVKSQFILATQHHLRTPLTAMKGYLSLIFEGSFGELNQKLEEKVMSLQESTNRIIKLVNEFLDISQFQVGKGILNLREIEIEKLISEIIEEFKPQVKEKGIYLKLEKPEFLPKIKADYEKLKTAIFNVIDNGIKYTERGGITVKCQTLNEKCQIIVEDTGIGLPEEEIKNLFTGIFERGKEAQKVYTTGRGIGLFIASNIISAHKGKIWVESEGKNKGSTFYIELPIK